MTATDVAAEDAIRSTLGQTLDAPVIGEERGGQAPTDGSAYWLVDPICGTRNFAAGIPLYCINVALVEGDQVTVAVVGDPSTGEIDVAEHGRGTWALTDAARRRVTVSGHSSAIVIEVGRARGDRREQAARFAASAIRADRWDLLDLDTTLSLAYVATGRVAAYVLCFAPAVHVGAGSLLAAEAGATVTEITGQPWTIRSDSIVASANGDLHRELLHLANDAENHAGPVR